MFSVPAKMLKTMKLNPQLAITSLLIYHLNQNCLRAYLSPLCLILAVFGKQMTQYISATAGDVDQRAFLS